MPRRHPLPGRRRAAAASALAGLLLAAGCSGAVPARPAPAPSGPATPTPTPTPTPPPGPYVALGDSYTSGLMIGPQTGEPKGCARSAVNYPSLVAGALGLAGADFRDVSCSAARTGDLTGTQRTDGGTNPPQLDALSPATRLVTLGIGGNDAGFVDVITECARQNLVQSLMTGLGAGPAAAAPCRDHYTAGSGADQVQRKVEAAGEQLAGVLREAVRRAPQARLYVVGYPALLPADPAACAPVLGDAVTPADLDFLAEKEQQLNAMLQRQARAAGAGFVDAAAASAGHDMCAGEQARWVEPPAPAPGLAPVHPNARGQQGMAQAVLKAVRQ
ncbi:SGNH/GDSL hydrolase family protein [Kitasatospora sp. NPDC057223]|uniref:SGNH/GDSL hydrolase family protein n=1 Tax=Kitasatospora sp. NPDC057223 TaxID=3346055 RepID=UPI003626A96A